MRAETDNPMKLRRIYRKTCCFTWPRVPYAVAGVFAVIWFPLLALRIFGGYDGAFSALVAAGSAAAAALLAKTLSSYGTKKARLAQLSMMARGLVYGSLPENVKTEGYRVAKAHFDYVTLSDMSKRALRKFYGNVLKKGSSGEEAGVSFLRELRSFAELYLMNMLPYVGECSIAWEFAYPGRTLEESMCDSLEVVGRNWKRMLFAITGGLLLLYAEMFLLIFAAAIVLVLIFDFFPTLSGIAEIISYNAGTAEMFSSFGENIALSFALVLIITALFPFAKSRMRLRILRTFFNCADINPPTGRLYGKIKEYTEK